MDEKSNKLTEMRWVGEIMTPLDQYPCILETDTLRHAIEVMEGCQLDVGGRKSLPRSLLVFDEKQCLVGYVRRRDIMRGLEPKFLVAEPLSYRKKLFDVQVDPNLSELSWDKVLKGMREQTERPVSEVMRPIEVTVYYEDHLGKAIYEIVSYGVTLLPVIKDKKVVGVVRSADVLRELAQLIL